MLATFISTGIGLAFALGAVAGIAVERWNARAEATPTTTTIPTQEAER